MVFAQFKVMGGGMVQKLQHSAIHDGNAVFVTTVRVSIIVVVFIGYIEEIPFENTIIQKQKCIQFIR